MFLLALLVAHLEARCVQIVLQRRVDRRKQRKSQQQQHQSAEHSLGDLRRAAGSGKAMTPPKASMWLLR